MIPVYKNSKIYVVCPAKAATGGPELLHQLVKILREDMNIESFIMYYPSTSNPVHPEYEKYQVPYVFQDQVEDDLKNILVVPEIKDSCYYLHYFNRIRKILWFLSIDNFFLSRSFIRLKFQSLINRIAEKIFRKSLFDINVQRIADAYNLKEDPDVNAADFYLAQSYMIKEFLEAKGLSKVFYLSDFINEEFLEYSHKIDFKNKENIVVYNPRKGKAFVSKSVRKGQKYFNFIPLKNMSRSQVIEVLSKAKVYIDFGNHPGKDRPPREAAILGCCVIVGKRGTASHQKDMPIPNEYKFECTRKNINLIFDKIKYCLEHYESCVNDFSNYRKMIMEEKQKFRNDVRNIFKIID